ncbi:MAG: diguanylate cyclase domain-containing protein, partial [Casimicrobium sp.]
ATNHQGDAPLALFMLREAFTYHNSLQQNLLCAATECQIGAAQAKLGDVGEAIAAYRRGIELYAGSNPRAVANAWHDLSTLQERAGDAAGALHSLRQALAAERRFNDQAAVLAAVKAEQKTEISRLAANWTRIAEEDQLTGLPNRRAFDQRLNHALSTRRADENLALAVVDVDRFKNINDQFGHQIGDQVLRALGRALSGALREDDFVARLGGEEFVLLFTCSDITHAQLMVERVLNAVRNFNWRAYCGVDVVTASAGVALQNEITVPDGELGKALYSLADRRLYKAKNLGRDRVIAREDILMGLA